MVIARIMPGPSNIVWPSFIKSVRNWIQTNILIRPQFDPDFGLAKFDKGARQAFLTISDRLAEGDVESLQGLVTDEVLDELKKSVPGWSMADRQKFQLKDSDIYLSFPHEVGIIMPDKTSNNRWVEIMAVYHTLRGFEDFQKDNISVMDLQQKSDRFLFGNFRFSRNFSKGINLDDSDWIVNYLHYFSPENEKELAAAEKKTEP